MSRMRDSGICGRQLEGFSCWRVLHIFSLLWLLVRVHALFVSGSATALDHDHM